MPIRLLTRQEIEKRFAPYKCKMRAEICPGVELWTTGWNEPFTLTPEKERYDEFQYMRALALIAITMPPGWKLNNG
jgi:hypothetical protein